MLRARNLPYKPDRAESPVPAGATELGKVDPAAYNSAGRSKGVSDLLRTTIAIDRKLLDEFDSWMNSHGYANRSEAIRDLIRSALIEQEWADPGAEVVAVLSVVYDHATHRLAQELTHVQHEDHHAIICSQHIHMDAHNCLEVILMQGKAARLRRVADKIVATRGVKAGKLSLLSRNV